MINEPYNAKELRDCQWLISMLESYCLEHGHSQERVNAWILAQLLQDETQDTDIND